MIVWIVAGRRLDVAHFVKDLGMDGMDIFCFGCGSVVHDLSSSSLVRDACFGCVSNGLHMGLLG